ncbi:hypothetical protein EDB84DRAFT_292856 [Lactarius hengduanensis]|nr:hypothetical protein EDB84DRAFT_292856 [Lactarius hengduanensis]
MRVDERHRWLIASRIFGGCGIITMSLLPIAVVVISFFLIFRALGRKAEKSEDSHLLQDNRDFDTGRRSTAIDPFQSTRNKPHPKPAPSTPPKHRPCRVCGVPGTKRCPRCKSVYYCSGDHITWDWRTHKSHCLPNPARSRSPSRTRTLPDAAEHVRGLRPGDTVTVAAYLFSVNADSPRVVQVTCTLREPEEGGYMWHDPNFKEYVQWPALGYVGVRRATPAPTAPPLNHALSILFHEFGLLDNQHPNRCVEKLVGGAGRAHQKWVGDIMLFREEVHDRYCDVKEEDLAPAIEYFRDYGRL